jgi:hypothetical protein
MIDKLNNIIENDTTKYGHDRNVAREALKYIADGTDIDNIYVCNNELYSRDAHAISYDEAVDPASWPTDWDIPDPDQDFITIDEWVKRITGGS